MSLVLYQDKQRVRHDLDFAQEVVKLGLVLRGGVALHNTVLCRLAVVGGRQSQINEQIWKFGEK